MTTGEPVRIGEAIRDEDEAAIISKWRATPAFGQLVLKKLSGRLASGEVVEQFKGPAFRRKEERA